MLASDIDPLAVRIATANARRNGVGNRVRVIAAAGMQHPEIRARAPYDLIVANILAGPLIRLAPKIANALAPGGHLVLSGLLPHQRGRVVAAYGAKGVRLMRAEMHDGWVVLELRRLTRRTAKAGAAPQQQAGNLKRLSVTGQII